MSLQLQDPLLLDLIESLDHWNSPILIHRQIFENGKLIWDSQTQPLSLPTELNYATTPSPFNESSILPDEAEA